MARAAEIFIGMAAAWAASTTLWGQERLPNVVIVLADDLGHGDLACFGADAWRTPHLDRLAAQGRRFTSFYVPQAVCSASRAALLTGCYPHRIGILGALGPSARHGIHPDETTLAELLKARGYATAIFGKWHLGHHPEFLPTRHGFDEFFGLPYSNDMWPFHPTSKNFPDLPIMENERVVGLNPDQSQLTTWYTERTVTFIERHRHQPFFVYLAHTMPHVPLHVSEKYRGSSKQGMYGDVVQEIDWSMGQILDVLQRHDLDEHTLVIFASDNGPWLSYGNHAGSTGNLREGKATTFEGGVRVPAVFRWTGHISPGTTCDVPVMTIDLFPTLASLSGAALPPRPIDGRDLSSLLAEEPSEAPPRPLFFYWNHRLEAVRFGRWKLHFPHPYRTLAGEPGRDGNPGEYREAEIGVALYDLSDDPGESRDVASQHPDVVARIQELAQPVREELGDSALGIAGRGIRAGGTLPD